MLKRTGSIYVAIGDEFAAELVLIMKRLGLYMKNWIIWHYTFGQHQKRKFTRSHTHILYFTKDRKDFVFNADAIRVPSARLAGMKIVKEFKRPVLCRAEKNRQEPYTEVVLHLKEK